MPFADFSRLGLFCLGGYVDGVDGIAMNYVFQSAWSEINVVDGRY